MPDEKALRQLHEGLNLQPLWIPFTANREFKAAPRLLVSAKDMHYMTQDGRKLLDGIAGLWAVNAGHCRPKIVEAIKKQAETMDYATGFQMHHPVAFQAAEKVVSIAPEGMDHVFFTNSGSEAVDTALKMALAFHRARGEGTRRILIGRERGYHGVGFGGISVGGMVGNRKTFGNMLGSVDHLRHTHDTRNLFTRGLPEHGAEFADDLERLVALHDASNIAAVIVEPVAGSTGVLLPPKGYLQKLRGICDKYGILLIFDEVITGFGRTGKAFAAQTFGVTPDMITCAKALTNAAVPMGGVIVKKHIYDTFMDKGGPQTAIEFFHGYTYSGHPLASAAACASLDLFKEEKLFERVEQLAPYWEECAHSLKGLPHVIDIRNTGLIGAIELEGIPGKPTARAFDAFLKCFDKGLLIRTTGDTIALSPPLIISKPQIDEIFGTLSAVIKNL
ncbi:MAG TPA: aspartate aminotransferase family protein, partial [Burkholderiales bacterium]|nr:aspartate aminotransferase family protein [Burkholderiales bacterium]